jgi:hypothetical protein
VLPGEKLVSFMRSYPMLVPLSARQVQDVVDRIAPFAYDRIYGAWWDRVIDEDGPAAVERSAARYIAHLGG